MTDLELIDKYCESEFIDPFIFRRIKQRGLYGIIDKLQGNSSERKAQARARLYKTGRYTGDPEIENIADLIASVDRIKQNLINTPSTEVVAILNLTEELKIYASSIKDFFK